MTHGCLCTHMRNYKVWTCGANASRLRETSVQREDGSWIEPTPSKSMKITFIPKAAGWRCLGKRRSTFRIGKKHSL